MYTEFNSLLEDIQENHQYEEYLTQHIGNVQKCYQWIKDHLPELLSEDNYIEEPQYYGSLDEILEQHDTSKFKRIPDKSKYYELTCEFDAYAHYFYGDKSEDVSYEFDRAWLAHIHANPHHWQHWVIPGEPPLAMPYVFVVEMILDWWSFSWRNNNLYEIFDWYSKHEHEMQLHPTTHQHVETILTELRTKLDEMVK